MIARGRPPRAAGRTVVSRFEFFMRLKESINGVRDARPQIAAGCCTAANGAKGHELPSAVAVARSQSGPDRNRLR